MNLIKKIAFGAYASRINRGDGVFFSYIFSRTIITFLIYLWGMLILFALEFFSVHLKYPNSFVQVRQCLKILLSNT
jgi:hypothetical protein